MEMLLQSNDLLISKNEGDETYSNRKVLAMQFYKIDKA
jgi:hypothetical protein